MSLIAFAAGAALMMQSAGAEIANAEDASLHDHLKAEQHSFVEALHHADGNEGISAFLQKRKPQYR